MEGIGSPNAAWSACPIFLVRPPCEFLLQDQPDWQEILTYFRGSELQNYFTRILEDDLHAIIKPQYVDHIPKAVRGNVEDVLKQKDGRGQREHLQRVLELEQVLDRDVEHLSGVLC